MTTVTLAATADARRAVAPEMARLLEDKQFFSLPKVGEVVRGRVLNLSKNEVHLDLGFTSGVIRGRELYHESPEYRELQVGDEVDATVVDLENELGEIELSFRFAGHRKTWEQVLALQRDGTVVEVEVVEANKGGLLVRLDHLSAFLPVSQLLPDHYPKVPGGDKARIQEKLRQYVGQRFKVKVLDASPDDEKLIVSEKKLLEDEQLRAVAEHRVGETVEGPITALTDFGAFLSFGAGLVGLVHISELAWQRIDHPKDVVSVGDTVRAQIININGPKVFLSRKRLLPDPWASVEERYHLGQTVSGRVLKVNSFGLFVEVDPEIHGLCHISELDGRAIEGAKPGDVLEFRVISLKPTEHRLGLSLRLSAPGDAAAPAADSAPTESAPA